MYSDKVMELFRHPKNIGEIKGADAVGKVGNPVCLPVGSMIHANDKFRDIDLLEAGQKVMSTDGHYNKIQRTISRNYNGEMLRIKNKLGITFLTPEHEVLAIKVPKRWKYSYAKGKKTLHADWHHASELEKGDLAVYPVVIEEKDTEFIDVPTSTKKWDFRSRKVPSRIKVDSEFLKFCGYYLAEGYLSDKVTKTVLGLTFNTSETDLVNDVEKSVKGIFGIKIKKRVIQNRKTIQVEINNVFVVRLFKSLFGTGAANKKIPHWMMLLPSKKQKSLLFGLWKGDGYFNGKKPRAGYATISYQLMEQIKTLLLKQEIIPSIYTEKVKRSKDGVFHKKVYRIHVGEKKSLGRLAKILREKIETKKPEATDSWFVDNHLVVPITGISKLHYDGTVHNLEIENSKSYVTESLSVHNCGDLMWVYLKIEKNEKGEDFIKDIKVKTFGCVSAIATSSALTEIVKGMKLVEAEKITRENVADYVGGLPPAKIHCSVLAVDGLQKAIEEYKKKKKR